MNSRSKICRYCKDYRPDERYRGVIGKCDKHGCPKQIADTCEDMEEGTQYWLNGEEVKE